jgi:hypothetical protein
MEAMHMNRHFWRSRWWMPAFCVFLGLLIAGAFLLGDDPWMALWGFGVMAALAALVFFGRRSETLQGLSGPGRDERWAMIDLSASAFAGLVLITAIIGLWLFEIASGRDGNPYGVLGALAGVAYIVGVAWGRLRR